MFTWHMDNPYVPHRWRNASNHAPDTFRYKPGVKGFPAEHRRLLAEIIDGTGGECGTGTIYGKTYYEPCKNPREWFGKILRRQSEFLNGLVDDMGRPIPVVIRYLHESDGGWFPWGAPYASADEFKKICRVICAYHRRNSNGDRLLFAYTPDRFWKPFGTEGDTNNTFLARYPGDEYTDILGIDDYSIGTGETDAKAQYRFRNSLRQLREISAFAKERGKVACISETGCKNGRVVFIENTTKYAPRTEEMLDCLRTAGVFDKAAAVVICEFNAKRPPEETRARLEKFAASIPCPVYSGYPYGHVANNSIIDFRRRLAISPDGTLVWDQDKKPDFQ